MAPIGCVWAGILPFSCTPGLTRCAHCPFRTKPSPTRGLGSLLAGESVLTGWQKSSRF